MKKYQPTLIEPKWQEKWAEDELYKTDLSNTEKKYYILVEFTYPSGDLHIGHWFTFAVPDILGRFKRMQGFNVFMPNGFDAFGLPAENAAIRKGIHPSDWTYANIKRMKEQFSLMGAMYDWSHEVITCDPAYYKWNQWIFLKMLERGLAYKGKVLSNWCPSCQTVLANENVEAGTCWRCSTEVIQQEVEQWFLKITDYADKLLWKDSETDWPKPLKEGQNNWIGKSQGTLIRFDSLEVFTTRPDTLFGVTFIVINPEHSLLNKFIAPEHEVEVVSYANQALKKSELERKESKEKTGVFTGSFVKHPLTGEQIPVWVADYVLAGYGTGAVMGVPAHDQRDFEFAKKYGLEIRQVIMAGPADSQPHPTSSSFDFAQDLRALDGAPRLSSPALDKAYEGDGVLINSNSYDKLPTFEAKSAISDTLIKKGLAEYKVEYHLHDWSISRQRYWGTPIPIIYCDKCGIVPVPEEDLPVELPYEVDYAPKGKPPLATAEEWMHVKCPKCKGSARREVETMDTFVDSSWYFFRYLDPKNDKKIFNEKVIDAWMPLEIYSGGSEHTLGHALYSRFFTKFLHDLGLINFDEYAKKRVHHGLILGPDGAKMSKSRGNVINPDEQVKLYGADAVRTYLAFLGPYDIVAPWNPGGVNGIYHFLERVWGLFDKVSKNIKMSASDLQTMHKTIKKVGEDIENIKFNTPLAALMEWLNHLSRKDKVSEDEYGTFLQLLAPFAPHITEELWELLGSSFVVRRSSESKKRVTSSEKRWSIHQQSWPEFDKKYLEEDETNIAVQVNGKVRDQITIQKAIINDKEAVEKIAKMSKRVQKFVEGKKTKKIIYVPGKILNLVVD